MDYNEFKSQIDSLQLQLQTFIDTWSRNAYTAEQSLEFLEKFQRLDGVKIDYNSQYSKLLQEYSRELETVRKLYEKNKTEPILSRNLPPISGRIAWSRQLYRRITTPIKQLAKRPEIIKSDEGKQIVRNYNRMAQVLLEYELVHYRSWCKSIEAILSGMNATILVKDNDSGDLLVNFDPQVTELIKESIYMKKMNLEIPEEAKSLILLQERIEENTVEIRELLERYKLFVSRFPKDLLPLMKPHKENVDSAIKPGLVSVTWASTNIEDYLTNIKNELDGFENLGNLVKDILECRVETALQEISVTALCYMPSDPCTIEEFVKLADETAQKSIVMLTKYITFCEAALLDILGTLKKHLNENDKKLVKGTSEEYYECVMKNEGKGKGQRCQECLGCIYFNFLTLYTQRNNDSLIQCK